MATAAVSAGHAASGTASTMNPRSREAIDLAWKTDRDPAVSTCAVPKCQQLNATNATITVTGATVNPAKTAAMAVRYASHTIASLRPGQAR